MADMTEDEFFEAAVRTYTSEPTFVEAVKRVMIEANGVPSADCVDVQILAELERPWDRNDPTNAFGLLESLKAENPRSWVSPEVSLRMFRSVEHLARTAINEATRA